MKWRKTLAAIVLACTAAGCAAGSRTIYEGTISNSKVKYEKVYSTSLGPEPDYRMTVQLSDNETWTLIDNNMDGMMKPYDDVVTITKNGESRRYRGITPMTEPVMKEADRLYQTMLEAIKNEKPKPISNKGLKY